MALKWYGDRVRNRVRNATFDAVNATLSACVVRAKNNHPWQNRTGTLERGIQVVEPAHYYPPSAVRGTWGVFDVVYASYLEFGISRWNGKKFPFLRPAADVEYPRLAERIRRAYGR